MSTEPLNEKPAEEDTAVHPLMKRFLYGQFANLFKFAFWWVSLAPLLFSISHESPAAVGIGRIVYNTALCVLTPIGAILVEHAQPRTLLLSASGIRFVSWCVVLPLAWVVFATDLVSTESTPAVLTILYAILFFDGVAVAISTVLDIDFCGVDIVAGRFGLDVTEVHRNQFNSKQEFFFACCFIVFAPALAFIGLAIRKAFRKDSGGLTPDMTESGTLVALFFATFLIATILQFLFLWKLKSAPSDEIADPAALQADRADETGDATPPPSLCQAIKGVPGDLWGGLQIILSNKAILFRLLFLGLEIAFEDAAIVVLAAQMGLRLTWLGDGDAVSGNVWTAVAVALGKLGGAIASILMMKFYQPPEKPMGYSLLFFCIGASAVAITGLPLITMGYDHGTFSADVARALFLVNFLIYFFLSTIPKLGLMALLQTVVMSVENGHRAFGFIAVIATTCDSLIIMGLSALFIGSDRTLTQNLWICAYIYLAHGLLESIFGPLLVLRPLASVGPREEQSAAGEPAPVEAAYTKSSVTVPLADGSTESAPIPIRRASALGAERRKSGLEGSFTPRHQKTLAAISASQPTPMGSSGVSAQRRQSGFEGNSVSFDGYSGQRRQSGLDAVRYGAPRAPTSPRTSDLN